MTELEYVLLGVSCFYQITLWCLLALQRQLNQHVKDVIEILLKEQP